MNWSVNVDSLACFFSVIMNRSHSLKKKVVVVRVACFRKPVTVILARLQDWASHDSCFGGGVSSCIVPGFRVVAISQADTTFFRLLSNTGQVG